MIGLLSAGPRAPVAATYEETMMMGFDPSKPRVRVTMMQLANRAIRQKANKAKEAKEEEKKKEEEMASGKSFSVSDILFQPRDL